MDSVWIIGAMASKKARESSPVNFCMSFARFSEVRGPVAMITDFHSSGGSPATSPRSISILECLSPRLVLLDEAFSAMDRATDERLWKLMEKWFKERAVIYTAHNPISLDKIKNETIEL